MFFFLIPRGININKMTAELYKIFADIIVITPQFMFLTKVVNSFSENILKISIKIRKYRKIKRLPAWLTLYFKIENVTILGKIIS